MLTFFQNSKFTNLELVFALECRFYAVIDRIISLPFGVGGMRSRLVEKAQQKRTRRQGDKGTRGIQNFISLTTRHSPLATRHLPLTTHHSPLAPRHSLRVFPFWSQATKVVLSRTGMTSGTAIKIDGTW